MSVATLVKTKESKNQTAQEKEVAKRKREKQRFKRQEFNKEVKDIIHRFESRCFTIDSTEKEVADFIVDWKGRRSLSWAENYFHAVKLSPGEYSNDHGDIGIQTHKVFQAWKKAMEDKFGIQITIKKEYEEEERFGNSGYRTYSDYHYTGLVTFVSVKV